MKIISATQAAKNFGQVLDSARNGHVTIEKQGRPVAVVYSYDESQAIEEMKIRDLKQSLEQGLKEFSAGKAMPFDDAAVARICAQGRKRVAAAKQKTE
ncbi:MAG: type II toxin-antitoxin system Phd/YefM family antitoxin [Pseudohongiella sp.]|nr:type II toxin-antitoxin system Phd/YefM family antitoxin [Pseudohongiella sp.]MDP2125787.1 type II toxin-antitoxin system Phd/YefM family antitoxin [Pseudohongiella sp.]